MSDDFQARRYRYTLKWLVRMICLAFVLAALLFWETFNQKQPAYYAAMTTGRIVPMHSLSEPVVTNRFIVNWTALTARRLFNLSFDSYESKLAAVKDHFTPGGWMQMQDALKSSGLITNMVNNKLIISSVVTGSPVILARMIVNGRFTWRVQMRLQVKFTSASQEEQEALVVTMNVQRIPTLDSAQGIQINDFVTRPADA